MAIQHAFRDQQPHEHASMQEARDCEADARAALAEPLAALGKRLTPKDVGVPGPLSVAAMEASDHESVTRELERRARALAKPTTVQPEPEANGEVPHDVAARLEPEPELEPEPAESAPVSESPQESRAVPDHHHRPARPVYRPQPPPPPPEPTWRRWLAETWWHWVGLALAGVVVLTVALVLLLLLVSTALVWWARLLDGLG